jgi:hypothetical protein
MVRVQVGEEDSVQAVDVTVALEGAEGTGAEVDEEVESVGFQ